MFLALVAGTPKGASESGAMAAGPLLSPPEQPAIKALAALSSRAAIVKSHRLLVRCMFPSPMLAARVPSDSWPNPTD